LSFSVQLVLALAAVLDALRVYNSPIA